MVWDSFTHRGRWGVDEIAWLQAPHAGLPGYAWAQYASGVIGLLIVGIAAAHYLRGRPRSPRQTHQRAWVSAVLPAVAIAGLVTGTVTAVRHISGGLHAMAFQGVVNSILVVGASSTLVCLAWRILAVREDRLTSP